MGIRFRSFRSSWAENRRGMIVFLPKRFGTHQESAKGSRWLPFGNCLLRHWSNKQWRGYWLTLGFLWHTRGCRFWLLFRKPFRKRWHGAYGNPYTAVSGSVWGEGYDIGQWFFEVGRYDMIVWVLFWCLNVRWGLFSSCLCLQWLNWQGAADRWENLEREAELHRWKGLWGSWYFWFCSKSEGRHFVRSIRICEQLIGCFHYKIAMRSYP